MDLLTLIDPYLPLIRISLLLFGHPDLYIFSDDSPAAYNVSRVTFRGAGKDYGINAGTSAIRPWV